MKGKLMSDQNKTYVDEILKGADWGSVIPGYVNESVEEETLEEGIYEDEETGKIYLVSEDQEMTELDDDDLEYLMSDDDDDEDQDVEDLEDDTVGFYEDEDGEIFYVSEDKEYFAVLENDEGELFFVNENSEVFEAWEDDDSILLESTGETLED
jgi:hypothetical protein